MMRCHRYTGLSPQPPIVTTPRLCIAALSLVALLAPSVAGAVCAPDPEDSTLIICSDLEENGFDALGANGLQVEVQNDATVSHAGATAGVINLNDHNVVDVQADESDAAEITASASGSSGIAANDHNTITNAGSIVVADDAVSGISANDHNGIVNSGTIEASTANGIGISVSDYNFVINEESITASGNAGRGISGDEYNLITNIGTIEASGANAIGISVLDNNIVTNEGGIIVSEFGLHGIAAIEDNTIENTGSIVVTGNMVSGISGIEHNQIKNSGTITAAGAESVALKAVSNQNEVQNLAGGEIILEGNDSVGIQADNDNAFAFNQGTIKADVDVVGSTGIKAGDRNPYVWNHGTITLDGDLGKGIEVGDDNSLTNLGTVVASGLDGIGVQLGTTAGTKGNALNNSGTITGGSESGVAVSFEDSGPDTTNTLENFAAGVIHFAAGVIDGSASDLAILGSDGAEQITNGGIITGDVELGAGDDAFILRNQGSITGDVELGAGNDLFSLGTDTVLDGTVDAGENADDSDTLRLRGGGEGTLDLSILGTALEPETLNDFEALDVDSSGKWTLSGTGGFEQGATVTRGTLALDGEVNLSGDYVQGEGTSLLVRLRPDGSNDRLFVDGDATIETIAGGATLPATLQATLELEPVGPFPSGTTQYEFLTTAGTLDGDFDAVNLPADTAVLSFFYDNDPPISNSLYIELVRSPYAGAGATGNQTATAMHLDEILDEILAADPPEESDMARVLASLDMLSTPELQAALDALHPEAYDAHSSAAFSFGRSVAELAAFRRPRCEEVVYERRPEIVAPSPCSKGWMLWSSAFGLFAERDGDSGHIDFSHGGGGLLVGADHPLGEHFLVYGFFGGGYTGLEVDGVGDGSFFSATVGAGGRWSLGGSRIHALLGYARGWHEQERRIAFGEEDGEEDLRISRTAEADYGSNLIMAFVRAGHTFRFGSLDLEPLATVEYGYLMEESFQESGADDLDLDVDDRSNSLLSTTVGARLAYSFFKWEYVGDFLEWADGIWTPEVTARWRGNWLGTERDLDARLAGAPAGVGGFTVEGQDAEQGLQVGAGVAFRPLRRLMSIRFDYDGFYGDGSMIHRIGASIQIPLGG